MSEPKSDPDEPGMAEALIIKIFGRSYRTTIAGLAAVVATLVPFVPGIPPDVAHAAQALAGLAAGAGLVTAKDSRVSGLPK